MPPITAEANFRCRPLLWHCIYMTTAPTLPPEQATIIIFRAAVCKQTVNTTDDELLPLLTRGQRKYQKTLSFVSDKH